MGRLIGEEVERVAGSLDSADVAINLCVSTMVDLPFVTGWLSWPDVAEAARAWTRMPPQNFTASYECAGWGYALSYARRHCWPGAALIVSVVDLNLLDISFWRESPEWGRSGFGVATVVLRVPAIGDFRVETGASQSPFHMGEFCAALRRWLNASPSAGANTPFLPPGMVDIYGRMLPKDRVLPDLHGRFGHCFGSDTWISFITHLGEGRLQRGGRYTATSASLRGFWSITDVRVAESGVFGMVDAQSRLAPV